MALYDQVYIYFNGDLLAENQTVDTELVNDDQEVMTTVQGFAGISPSPTVRRVSFEEVVPVAGAEKNFEDIFLAREQVTLTLALGGSGQKCTSTGYLVKRVGTKGGVGQTTIQDLQFVGSPSPFA